MAGSEGVEVRHRAKCGTHKRRACSCRPSVRAKVKVDGQVARQSFNDRGAGSLEDRITAAKTWRIAAVKVIRAGGFPAASDRTIKGLMEEFLTGAVKGHIRARKGQPYAPSTLHRMRQAVEYRVIPQWGERDPDTLTADEIERFVEDLNEQGLSASSVQNTIKPLSAMYRWARRTRRVNGNPTIGVLLPTGGRKRDQIATPDEAAAKLAALNDDDRVLWALAFYGGLRRSEALAMRWANLDTKNRKIRVRESYHVETGTLRDVGKSEAALRTVPMPGPLVAELARHALRIGNRDGFVIGGDAPRMPHWTQFLTRAYQAWDAAGLSKLCFHEARHTYASWIIAAAVRSGEHVDYKVLAALMGHASIAYTITTYQKLMPDHVDRAGRQLDQFLTDYGRDDHAETV